MLEIWPAIVAHDKVFHPPPGWRKVEPDVMPADQADQHILLWDAVYRISRESGHTPEWHWLRLIDAFLRGDLAQSGLVHFYRNHDVLEPRGYQRYSPDDLRAAIEMRAGLANLTIESLRNWSWKDYKKLPEFSPPKEPWLLKDYFVERDPDGRFGLAISIAELDHWLADSKAVNPAAPVTPAKTLATAGGARTSSVKTRRRGPVPGTVDRYGEDDRKMFGELERIKRAERISIFAAAKKLAEAGKIAGTGTAESRATRLARRYRQEKGSQNSL